MTPIDLDLSMCTCVVVLSSYFGHASRHRQSKAVTPVDLDLSMCTCVVVGGGGVVYLLLLVTPADTDTPRQ